MYYTHETEHDYRHGDHGPKYLMMGPKSNFGIVRLRPGDQVSPHHHGVMEENFYILDGQVTITIDGNPRIYGPGDFIHLDSGEVHSLSNAGDIPARFIVVTNPYLDHADKIAND
ncbi:cupin domain-containing protein [Eubacterium barkeri]|uniref:Cupin domain-containing protein n=1 Tax=Eubacterium barkeri TaxID=1528 RepID=A0A1H3HCC5_EUBBA|nr:cupin domain-containing protein [Eubacterium barkeri]SDY12299.1 Cupin domain-containing protein [Eubacterium barkeri]